MPRPLQPTERICEPKPRPPAFGGLTMHDLGIKYSVANAHGQPTESRELVITNYEPGIMGGLF